MITRKVLEAFEAYLSSGQFEEDFSYSSEERRGEMLETADLFMDISEKVDEVVTRIIFKGIGVAVPSDKDNV